MKLTLGQIEIALYVFVLATFLGFEVIRRVPSLLHTPLMSLTNAISGIALVGSLVLAGAKEGKLATILGTLAVTASTINVGPLSGSWSQAGVLSCSASI